MMHINKFILKIILISFLLNIGFQSWTTADDITEFEIEGISVGDSAIDHIDEKLIQSNKVYMWENKKYASYSAKSQNNNEYSNYQIFFLDNDPKYIIQYISGFNYIKNLDDCDKIKKNLVSEIKNLVPNTSFIDYGEVAHPGDKTGKSLATKVIFQFKDNSEIMVTCTVFSKDYKKIWDVGDTLSVSAHSSIFTNYLLKEAY